MKVLCLQKDKPGDHPDLRAAAERIQVGSAYTVVAEDDKFYELAEFPHPLQMMWEKKNFAILPDTPAEVIEETELVTA